MRRGRAVVVAAALAVGAVVALFAARQGAPGVPAAAAAASAASTPLTVRTTLPAWRAPGVPLSVTGFAGAQQRVFLRANNKLVARAWTGRLGSYRLGFAGSKPGRYRLVVTSRSRSHVVGTLVVRPVVVAAVGDITFGEQVGPTIAELGVRYPWTQVASTLRAADITIGNLETAVSTRGIAAVKEYTFRGSPSALPALSEYAGFDVLSLANNHAVDYGREALLDTIRNVRAAGMKPIGAGANDLQARRPAIVERGGLNVAFLGYSDVNPLGFVATSDLPGTARADTAAIAADVRAALRRADVVACFFHWGTELHADPDSRQQMYAAACLNAGAKLVIGAHPHVLGTLGRPTRSTLVAWTLGNFVFPSSGITARSAVLRVDLNRRGVGGYRLLPVTIEGFRPSLTGTDS